MLVAPRHHIIISDTGGRAGTTFLVQLLTELGLDTGFPDAHFQIYPNCNAGMEFDICDSNASFIIKSPWLCDYLDDVLTGGDVVVDHVIVPMRDLYSAAQSRRDVTSRTNPSLYAPDSVPGRLWHTNEPEDQEVILTAQLYKLIYTLAKYDVPLTLLLFPVFVNDPEYLYRKIKFVLDDINYQNDAEDHGREPVGESVPAEGWKKGSDMICSDHGNKAECSWGISPTRVERYEDVLHGSKRCIGIISFGHLDFFHRSLA
jgi:hypothetical protein